ncbi:MAG: hypothetical protein AAB409_08405, partial [Gemmatimonadota bacterium]
MSAVRSAFLLALALATSSPAFAQRQQPQARGQARPAPQDTARRDTAQARDSLGRFVESMAIRHLGPMAYSGRVTAIAVPRSTQPRPNTFYIGSAGGGVWKTTNAGVTWSSASSGLGSESIGDLAVAPSDSNLLWAGTGEKNSLRSAYWGDGVYKSTNGATTWTALASVP